MRDCHANDESSLKEMVPQATTNAERPNTDTDDFGSRYNFAVD
jgi:hypothetical protein